MSQHFLNLMPNSKEELFKIVRSECYVKIFYGINKHQAKKPSKNVSSSIYHRQ
jgi:hypothetical protein